MKLRALWYAVAGVVWASVPLIALAATSGGIVPCVGATDCNLCTFGQLIQNIINFAIGLSIPLSAVLFSYAGWLYFSNRENTSKIEQAHRIFTSVFIGFCIAIGGWLIVQTVLKTLAPGYQSWTTFDCTQKRDLYATIGQLFNQSGVPGVDSTPITVPQSIGGGGGSTFGVSCPDGSTPSVTEAGNFCTTANGVIPATGQGNSGAGTQQWASQLQQACATSGLSDCALAQAIMANESSGRPGIVSSAGAVGLMQMMPATARGLDPSLSGLSDDQIAQRLATDTNLNMQLGTQYIAQLSQQFNGDPALIAAAYNGGAKANNPSNTCSGQTQWQCTANPGYAETRNYVPKVLSTYNQLK